MMPSGNKYRNSGGVQDAVDRLVDALRRSSKDKISNIRVEMPRHTVQQDVDIESLISSFNSPPPTAVRVNLNDSPSKFYFMMGKDTYTDDIVLG